jgi:N4-gp56 family major capsid protein
MSISTQDANLAPEVRQHYDKKLLITAQPLLQHLEFFEKMPIPKGEGNIINMRRAELIPVAVDGGGNPIALVEGVTPSSDALQMTNVQITCNQYGRFLEFTDRVVTQSIDPMLSIIVGRQGQQSGRTFDKLGRAVMNSGTIVRYSNGRVSRATVAAGDVWTAAEVKKLKRTLVKNFALRRKGGTYVCVISPDSEYDLQNINEWLAVKEYSDKEGLYKGEIGTLYGIRFVVATEAQVFTAAGAAGIDVHSSVAFGEDAFGASEIDGLALKTISKPLGYRDPLDQVGSQGWKGTWGGAILNNLFVCRLEHAVTA